MDAQALCDAAVLGDADGIRLCLGMHEEKEHDGGLAKLNDSAGKAWFYALFSRLPELPRITPVKEEEAVIEINTTELPSVQFENSHVIQGTPHVALRVLLLLPPWYELPWCAIHATIEEIRQNKILARHALSCLSEIRLFLSGCSGNIMQRSNLNIRDATNRFCRDQLVLLVECAADPLIYNRAKFKNLSNPQENQHLVLPLEIIPSILRLAMRIEPVQENNNAQSSIVVELCDMLFCSNAYLSSNSLASTLIVSFLSLAMDCASYLQDRHWYMVQQRVLYCLHPSVISLHPQHYAALLRQCLGILSGFPILEENPHSSMLPSVEKSDSGLSDNSQTDFMLPDAKHRWEYVILQLYYAASCLSKSDPSILPAMDMVFLSSLGQLPFSVTMGILRFISWFVADLLQLPPESEILALSRFASAVDQDFMFCVCSNLTLLCLKSQDIPRRTFNLAASALGIGKGQIIESSEEVVNTLLIIVHVKSILSEGKSILEDDPRGHQSYNDRLTAITLGPGAKERSEPLTQHMEWFLIELTKLATAFFFVNGGICRVEAKSCVPNDEARNIETFSAFLSASANIVYQSINIERDFNRNDLKKRQSPTYIEKETSMPSFLTSSHKMPKPTDAVVDLLRSSCLDVILCFLLSRDKFEAYTDETQSSNELLLIAIDGLLKAQDMPSNIDANSKIRIDSAISFFNLTKFSDTPFRYYYAVKCYCNTTQSEMLKDATTMDIGLHTTFLLMDSLTQMHHQAAFMDRASWLLFMDPEENSSFCCSQYPLGLELSKSNKALNKLTQDKIVASTFQLQARGSSLPSVISS